MKIWLLLLVLLIGCDDVHERVNIYAINKQYVSEEVIYSLIKNKVSNDEVAIRKKSGFDIYGDDGDIRKIISSVTSDDEGINDWGNLNFILIFSNKQLEYSFENETDDYPECSIYYFHGYFENKKIESESGYSDRFVVDDYKIMSKYPKCFDVIKKKRELLMKEMETDNGNTGNTYNR
ncbi:hypothetical protein CI266_005056 [Salmonella enterica subsp. enterica serovar Kotte]|nr:hypothetical protein [Salmonella enterica subsp. enterica serovar Kotte]HED5893944.1 hypothetical protein [Salmonella enterica]